MSIKDPFIVEHIICLSGSTVSPFEVYFHLTLVLWGTNRQWRLAGWTCMIYLTFPWVLTLHSTWQEFVVFFPVTEKTSYYIIPLSPDSGFVGNGHFMNEEQIENWACAVPWPTVNTEPASQVISLGCSWLWLWWRLFITPKTMTAREVPNQGCVMAFFHCALDFGSQRHRGSLLSGFHWCFCYCVSS